MEEYAVSAFILALLGLTSLAAYAVAIRWLRLSRRDLWVAGEKMIEGIGLALVFLVLNLATGIIAILAFRALSGVFVPVYLVNDVTLGVLSFLQGFTFQWWRELRQADGSRRTR